MLYARLGDSGLVVSRLALGAMTFAEQRASIPAVGKVRFEEADRLVGMALDAGVNFFDTADVYSDGESEELLGRTLQRRRGQAVIATKVGGRMSEEIGESGLSRAHILASVDRSLRRLGTDWIDVYIVHREDPLTPLEETLETLDTIVRAGKVRYLGFSNWSAWTVAAAMEIVRARGLTPFTHGQMYYSLVGRDVENEIVPMMQRYGLGLTAWSPLASGLLSGKYSRDAVPPEDSRLAGIDFIPVDRAQAFDILGRMTAIAAGHGASVAQVAIAWLLAKESVSTVILGAAKASQLADNLGAAEVRLSAEEVAMLDAASARPRPYPGWHQDRFADHQLRDLLSPAGM